jgi:hypothetical protein
MAMELGTQWSKSEQDDIGENCTSVIDQLSPLSCTIHPMLVMTMIADVYEKIGTYRLTESDLTEDNVGRRAKYLKYCKTIREQIGDKEGLAQVECATEYFNFYCGKRIKAREAFGQDETEEERLERHRVTYQMSLENDGEVKSLNHGSNYAAALSQSNHTIAAWRLLKRLAAISKQYHGRDHVNTKELEAQLKRCKTVRVKVKGRKGLFEALFYENDEYVIQGPIQNPRAEEEEDTINVAPSKIILQTNRAAPVICHGLLNAIHLNGKIGEVKSFSESTGRYGIHFEGQAIEPMGVKPENLSILFELPDN